MSDFLGGQTGWAGLFNRARAIDLLFALTAALAATTKLRFLGGIAGAAELCGILAIFFVLMERLMSLGWRGLVPSKWFTLAWGVFWICAIAGSITRRYLADTIPLGFTHDLQAMLFLTALSWAFLQTYGGADRAMRLRRFFAICVMTAAPLYLLCLIGSHLPGIGDYFIFHNPVGDRFTGLAENPNQTALAATIYLFLALHLAGQPSARGRLAIFGWLMAAVACGLVLHATDSDAGTVILLLLPVLLLVGWGLTRTVGGGKIGWKLCVVLTVLVIAGGGAFGMVYGEQAGTRLRGFLAAHSEKERRESNFGSRFMLLQNARQAILKSPAWGVGFGGNVDYHAVFGPANQAREAHNTFVDITLASGILGLLAAGLVFARAYWNTLQQRAGMLLAGLMALTLFGLVHNYLRQPSVWFVILACILYRTGGEWRTRSASAAQPDGDRHA